MEAIVKARSGSVLGKGSILKMYFFPGQRTSSHIQIHGAPHVYQGPESDELAAVSRLEDDVNFYQTVDPKLAKLFHLDPEVKRPALSPQVSGLTLLARVNKGQRS